ncbi:MAG: hypothetical protein AAFN06_10435 [Pseudomonadota bacterium]
MPKIAICFFGISRSLPLTMPSIAKNAIDPARAIGDVAIYAHLFNQRVIDNPRTREKGEMDPEAHKLLNADWLELEEPEHCLEQFDFAALTRYGYAHKYDENTLRNLLHQLHSLRKVTEAALADGPDAVVFCRPDLRYLDSLLRPLRRGLRRGGDVSILPSWENWGGRNDRFAICIGAKAARAYGCRIEHLDAFSATRVVHSESLVPFALEKAGIDLRTMPHRAERVRFNGRTAVEEFRHSRVLHYKRTYGIDLYPLTWIRYLVMDR